MEPKVIKGFDPAPPGQFPLKKALLDSDFDGCICGAILLSVYPDLELAFADPASVQTGKFNDFVDSKTVVADLCYVPGCGLWFDHHLGNIPEKGCFAGRCGNTPSAAELLYDYFKDVADLEKFTQIIPELGKFDFAQLSMEEVKHPNDYVRIGFAIDRKDIQFCEYFTRELAQYSWEHVLADKMVVAKLTSAENRQRDFLNYIQQHTQIIENVAFVDNRNFKNQVPHSFFVYTAFPGVDGVVMISGDPEKTKFGLFANPFNPKAKDINFLSIARVMNPEISGGHKGGCGFNLLHSMTVEDAVSLIGKLLRNFS